MRFLANENFPYDAVIALREQGYDISWIRTEAPGISDEEVLKLAGEEDRILITFDKDFGELVYRSRLPEKCGVILFRIPMPSSDYVARMAVITLQSRNDWSGHFSVIEANRIRMRPLLK